MGKLIQPVLATSVGGGLKSVTGPAMLAGLRAAAQSGNPSLLNAELGRGGMQPQSGVEGDVPDATDENDDE